MFDHTSDRDRQPDYQAAAQQAFDTLLGYIEECQKAGLLPEGDPRPLALAAWSTVHGIARLAVSSHLPLGKAAVPDFTDQVTKILLSGYSSSSASSARPL
jgi:AcrR family transcriptional regulator